MKLDDVRREYLREGLKREDLADEPFAQFEKWLQQAVDIEVKDPTAMCVATVGANGQPSQRMVLLKDFSAEGFVFYTNLGSRKAQEIGQNDKVCLHFPWHNIERQVIVYGTAQKLPTSTVMKYFLSRPKESQLAAWASEQSRPVSSRQALMQKFGEMKHKFSQGEVPLPSFWGGYLIKPHQIEFWQGGGQRLHDRFMYTLDEADKSWNIEQLAP
ncbi:MAG: pyridoxamine 5'-phosphate oxidase [Alteromonadaceae bacterium]|jgi:pyridoxamine 5'-phosphate oxidase